jgi:hypothetical protein
MGCLTVFTYLFAIVSYDYIRTYQELLFVDWDVKTITAADYTVEFKLEKNTHQYWQKHFHDPTNPMSENMQFKLYVEQEFEKRINQMEDLGYDAPS